MSRTKSAKGFSAIEAVIIVLVVAVLGLGGWYVWQRSKNDEPSKRSNNTSQNNNQSDNEDKQPIDPSEGGKYLVITEWGVRFLLPEGLRGDVEYSVVTSPTETAQTAWFEVGRIAQLPGSNCKLSSVDTPGNSGKSGGIGVYLTRTESEIPQDQTKTLYVANARVGDYWYSFATPKGSCLTDQSSAQLEADTARSLADAIKGLQPVPIED